MRWMGEGGHDATKFRQALQAANGGIARLSPSFQITQDVLSVIRRNGATVQRCRSVCLALRVRCRPCRSALQASRALFANVRLR